MGSITGLEVSAAFIINGRCWRGCERGRGILDGVEPARPGERELRVGLRLLRLERDGDTFACPGLRLRCLVPTLKACAYRLRAGSVGAKNSLSVATTRSMLLAREPRDRTAVPTN